MDAIREGLAAVPLAAHRLGRPPGQVVPDPGGFLVAVAVLAVAHVAVVQALHEGPRLEEARLRVLEGPPPGPQPLDDLQRAQDEPVAGLEVAGPPAEGPGVLGADRAGPHHVEAAQQALVQLHHVAAQRGLELRLQVHLPRRPCQSSPSRRTTPGASSFSGSRRSQARATRPAARQASSRLQMTHSRQVMGDGGVLGSWSNKSIVFFWGAGNLKEIDRRVAGATWRIWRPPLETCW